MSVQKEESKKDELLEALSSLSKKYGTGVIVDGNKVSENLEVVDSGSLKLNIALGCGGVPMGKLIEIMGPESSGKSTLTLHMIANFQKEYPEKRALYVDMEHSFSKKYAMNLGINMDTLIISQPECAEDAYNIMESLIRTGKISIAVLDSHTAAIPKAVVDAEVGKATIALQARVNSVALGKIKPLLSVFNTTMIAVSQLRTALGSYIVSDVSTGGNSYKFYSDIRLKISRKVDKQDLLDATKVVVIKNKCGSPFNEAEFNIDWGKGINRMKEIVDLSIELGIIEKTGSWLTIEGQKLQGIDKVVEFMEDNEELYNIYKEKIMKNDFINQVQ